MSPIDTQAILTYARNNVSAHRISRVFHIPHHQVLTILSANGITPAVSKRVDKPAKERKTYTREPGDKPPAVKETPAAVARRTWGNRLSERDGDNHLDGRRIGFDDLVRKTNQSLIGWEMDAVTGHPGWVP